jgi:hypothetical protein
VLRCGGIAAIGAALAAATALGAGAAGTKQIIPTEVQFEAHTLLTQLAAKELDVIPTRLPPHYAFESYSVTGQPLGLDVSFADQRQIKDPNKTHELEISFDSSYLKGALGACGAKARRTIRVGGTGVFVSGTTVWRCLPAGKDRSVRVAATGKLAPGSLAVLVAYARPAA